MFIDRENNQFFKELILIMVSNLHSSTKLPGRIRQWDVQRRATVIAHSSMHVSLHMHLSLFSTRRNFARGASKIVQEQS